MKLCLIWGVLAVLVVSGLSMDATLDNEIPALRKLLNDVSEEHSIPSLLKLPNDVLEVYRASEEFFDSALSSSLADDELYFAVGLLAPFNARKAFPCFDEPEFKARFQLSIEHEKGLRAVSNMPIEQTRVKGDHLVESQFEPTPQMSTYLLQFLVSDFSSKTKNESSTKIRVWAVENSLNYTDFALAGAKTTLKFFENYTRIPYPLPKLAKFFNVNIYILKTGDELGTFAKYGLSVPD
ncbi:hypothetical protein QZH41_002056 [Actinostola sp. cb2023]|nr:hypothetical protein QZH41_002056 [Actinostola sp. cb2023]